MARGIDNKATPLAEGGLVKVIVIIIIVIVILIVPLVHRLAWSSHIDL